MRVVFCLIPMLAAGVEPVRINLLRASMDGTRIALATETGQLGVLNLESDEAMPVFTHHLGAGFHWSRDGSTLLFVESLPGQPPQIMEATPIGNPPPQALTVGADWKADPAWFKPGQWIFRSDWNSDRIRIVAMETPRTTPTLLMESASDIAALWVSPLPGELVYATAEAEGHRLYWHGARPGDELLLSGEQVLPIPAPHGVAFSPGGTRLVFARSGQEGTEVVLYDLDLRRELATVPCEVHPAAFMMPDESSVVMELNGALIQWHPDRKWRRDLSGRVNWNGIELTHPVRLSDRGVAAVIGGSLVVTASSVGGLPSGKIHTSRIGDLLELSIRLQALGRTRDARRMMDQLWAAYQETPETNLLVASTRAVMETITPRQRPLEAWLDRTIRLSGPDGAEFDSAWHARLIHAWFEDGDAKRTREILRLMPERTLAYPLVDWIRESMSLREETLIELWPRVVRDLRRKDWERVAGGVLDLVNFDTHSDFTRRGVALLVRGSFEPLADLMLADQLSYPELMREPEFQEAMVRLAGGDLSPELGKADFRGMLLLHWAKGGEMEAARNLVMVDLSDPLGSSLDYDDILSRYLIAEEQEPWVARAVDEIFLSKRIAYLLQRHMNIATSHLAFSLTKAKNALVKGDLKSLDSILAQLDSDMLIIPADFWSSDNAFYLYLIRLFQAKAREAAGQWADALNSYAQAAQVIERFPSDWDIIALDLGMARSLLESAMAQGEGELRELLAILKRIGDPLVGPSRDAGEIQSALGELRKLEGKMSSMWLKPYILYAKGLAFQLLGRHYEAVVNLGNARKLAPPRDLQARILFEEAAARSVLTQSRLASGVLDQFRRLPLKPSQLVVGLRSLAQAEHDAGLIPSQEARLRELCRECEIPWYWSWTLFDTPPAPLDAKPARGEPQG